MKKIILVLMIASASVLSGCCGSGGCSNSCADSCCGCSGNGLWY